MSKVPEWVIAAASLAVFVAMVWLLIYLGGRHVAKPLVEAADGKARGATAAAGVSGDQLKNSTQLHTQQAASQKVYQDATQAVVEAPNDGIAYTEFLRGLRDLQHQGSLDSVPGGPEPAYAPGVAHSPR